MRINKKIAVAVAATAVVALGGTAAYAFFTSTGTGGGSATVGSATAWQIVVGPTSGPLFPGGVSQTFPYSVNNTGSTPQTLNLVTAAINSDINGDVPGTATGCKSIWFTISLSGAPAGPVAGGGSNVGTGTITMIDSGSPQDACQGTAPTFTLSAS